MKLLLWGLVLFFQKKLRHCCSAVWCVITWSYFWKYKAVQGSFCSKAISIGPDKMFGSEGEDTIEVGITFSIFYALFTLCFITQSMEFKSAGISPEAVLEAVGWLSQSQDLSFCQFQLRRTSGNLVIHRYGHYHINYFFLFHDWKSPIACTT